MPHRTEAAITGQETEEKLIGTKVGRYKINYIGNTNHYTWYSPNGGAIDKKIYNDLGAGYANSSVANLERSTDTSKIKYAYLVWQTRAKQGVTEPVVFSTPDRKLRYISGNAKHVLHGNGCNGLREKCRIWRVCSV